MKKTTFLQDTNGISLKENLHSHSTFSDGNLTPEEIKEQYKHHNIMGMIS